MTNRIFDLPPFLTRNGLPLPPEFQDLRHQTQRQLEDRLWQLESYFKLHPATAIGVGVCIGVFVGWIIKRR